MLRITWTTRGLASILLLAMAASVVAADQIRVCVNPAGQVRLAAPDGSCRSQEYALVWNRGGLPGPAGPQGPEGPQGAQGPEGPAATGSSPALVLDSNETIVGHYISRTGDVLVHIGSDRFVAGATQQGFVSAGTFIHRDEACADTPSIVANVDALALAQKALVKPGEAWLPDLAAAKIDLPANSVVYTRAFFADGSSTSCSPGVFSNPATLMPLRSVPLGAFLVPFHLQ